LKKDLLDTVKELLELQKQYPIVARGARSKGESEEALDAGSGGTFEHSTETIANLLDAKTGSDLIIAAAAHLHFVKGKRKFTKREIIAEMRTATGHYKKSYHGNLTASLNTLKKQDQLRPFGNDTYSLSTKKAQELEAQLAEH
jgi:hypothetical protein